VELVAVTVLFQSKVSLTPGTPLFAVHEPAKVSPVVLFALMKVVCACATPGAKLAAARRIAWSVDRGRDRMTKP